MDIKFVIGQKFGLQVAKYRVFIAAIERMMMVIVLSLAVSFFAQLFGHSKSIQLMSGIVVLTLGTGFAILSIINMLQEVYRARYEKPRLKKPPIWQIDV